MPFNGAPEDFLTLYNLVAHSPFVNKKALLEELFRQFGLDPAKFVQEPQTLADALAALPKDNLTATELAFVQNASRQPDPFLSFTKEEFGDVVEDITRDLFNQIETFATRKTQETQESQ